MCVGLAVAQHCLAACYFSVLCHKWVDSAMVGLFIYKVQKVFIFFQFLWVSLCSHRCSEFTFVNLNSSVSSGPAKANATWLLTLLDRGLFLWRAEAELVNNRYSLNCNVPLPCKFGSYSQCQHDAWTTYDRTCPSVLSFHLCCSI